MLDSFERETNLLTHKEQPQNTAELQVLLMEEYYLSQHPETSSEKFLGPDKNAYESAMAHEWDASGLRAKFRQIITDPKNKEKLLNITLDDVKFYS